MRLPIGGGFSLGWFAYRLLQILQLLLRVDNHQVLLGRHLLQANLSDAFPTQHLFVTTVDMACGM